MFSRQDAKRAKKSRNPPFKIPLFPPFPKGDERGIWGKEGDLRNLGVLCGFARVIVFPTPDPEFNGKFQISLVRLLIGKHLVVKKLWVARMVFFETPLHSAQAFY
jgi:hypothetical protein